MAERGQNPFGPGLGHDPARLTNKPTQGQGMITNRRVELPKEAYALDDAGVSGSFTFALLLPDFPMLCVQSYVCLWFLLHLFELSVLVLCLMSNGLSSNILHTASTSLYLNQSSRLKYTSH